MKRSNRRRSVLVLATSLCLAFSGAVGAVAAPVPSASAAAAAPVLSALAETAAVPAQDSSVDAAAATDPGWFTSWTQSQQRVSGKVFSNQSMRMITHLSQGGDKVRIRLQNQYGTAAVTIDQTNLAISVGGPAIDASTDRALTFGGSRSVTIPVGAEVWSDPTDIATTAQQDVAVTFFLSGSPVTSLHDRAGRNNYGAAAGSGNRNSEASGASFTEELPWTYFVSAVDVYNTDLAGTIVAYGSSVVDGDGSDNCGPGCSAFGQNKRWTDDLARRVVAELPVSQQVAVVNEGIGGTVSTNACQGGGIDGVSRLDRDVLALHGVTAVIYYYGTNDLAASCNDVKTLAAYRTTFARLRAAGIKVFVTPITPRPSYTAEQNGWRATVNAFVRQGGNCSGTCDGVLDFDAVLKDPANANSINPSYDNGDGVHANVAGQQAIADSIPLPVLATAGAPSLSAGLLPTASAGSPYSFKILASGFPAPSLTVSTGALPDGLSLDAATGTITGIPAAAGTATFTIRASNGVGQDATGTYTLNVFAASGDGSWFTSWTQSQERVGSKTFTNQSMRIITHLSQGGDAVRVRLQNQFGATPVTITQTSLALSLGGAKIDAATSRTLTFGGSESVTIPKGGEVWSDPTSIVTGPQQDVALTFFVTDTTTASLHEIAGQSNYAAPAGSGNLNTQADGASYGEVLTWTYFVSAVDVYSTSLAGTIVAYGGSMVEGAGVSSADYGLNKRWTDVLARRAAELPTGQQVAVVNEGINLANANFSAPACGGGGADSVSRLDRDVLALHGVTAVILYNGGGDVASSCGSDAIISSYRLISQRLRTAGIKLYLVPITPRAGFSATQNADRATVNSFVTAGGNCSGTCDGVLDFDSVLKDPTNPNIVNPAYKADDTTASTVGQKALADAVPLSMLTAAGAPAITSGAPTGTVVGTPYSFALTASGFPAPTFAVTSGALPDGLTLDATTGRITGTTTRAVASTFTATASNGNALQDAATYTIYVSPTMVAPAIEGGAAPDGVVQSPYVFAVTATGYPSPTFAVTSGALPAGLSLSSVSGILSGVPTTVGSSTFTITASNGAGTDATVTYAVTVTAATSASASITADLTVITGKAVTVQGVGFAPGETVDLSLGSSSSTAVVNGSGGFSATITAPGEAGLQSLVAVGRLSQRQAGAVVNVEKYTGSLSVPASVAPGASFTAHAGGFRVGETISLKVGTAAAVTAAVLTGGTADATLTAPGTPGTYPVTVTGQTSGATATADLVVADVVPPVVYTPSIDVPASTATGGDVTVTGAGFAPHEHVVLTHGAASTGATADAEGAFTVTIAVPATPGAYAVSALGELSGVVANAVVTVEGPAAAPVPSASNLTPQATYRGAVMLHGADFAASSRVVITSGDLALGSAAVDSQGTFTAQVDLPAALLPGIHLVQVAGNDGDGSAVTSLVAVTVVKATASASITAAASSLVAGKAVVITVVLSDGATGTVELFDGTRSLGVSTIAGNKVTRSLPALSVGSHAISAVYAGDAAREPARTSAVTITVVKAAVTTLKISGKKYKAGKKLKATVKISARLTNGLATAGVVRVYVGKKLAKTVRLTAFKKGKATVALPKKYSKGKSVKLKATYVPAASATTSGTTSKTVKIKRR